MESDKAQKQFNLRPIPEKDDFLLSATTVEKSKFDFDGELFSRARKRRESAAIFNRLNEG